MQTFRFTNSSCLLSTYTDLVDLYVTMKNGDVYKYPGEASHFEPLTQAESAGKYFNKHLVPNLNAICVG